MLTFSRAQRISAVVLAAILIAGLVWWSWRPQHAERHNAQYRWSAQEITDSANSSPSTTSPSTTFPSTVVDQESSPLPARDPPSAESNRASQSKDSSSTSETATKFEPHPPSQEREALLKERLMFENVERAISSGDYQRATELLAEVPRTDETERRWADRFAGYPLLVECLSADVTAAAESSAQAFLEKHRASPLRRKIRRACLGELHR